ncbi:MAG TPA: ATP-binding protein, partial [Angustibacter sp.]|nr:ATP-binding protein [Angustibacter sp.]
MDWYLAGDDPADVTSLRHRIRDHLLRHAAPGTDVSDAELVVQELLANAFEHAEGPAWVHLTWADDRPHLVVRDLGAGFALPAASAPDAPQPGLHDDEALWSEGGRGLWLVSHLAGELEVAARRGGGTEVHAVLPVQRVASRSIDPLPLPVDVLPGLDEAQPEGGFGRETFLRALVVQLSQAVEHTAGPDVG